MGLEATQKVLDEEVALMRKAANTLMVHTIAAQIMLDGMGEINHDEFASVDGMVRFSKVLDQIDDAWTVLGDQFTCVSAMCMTMCVMEQE